MSCCILLLCHARGFEFVNNSCRESLHWCRNPGKRGKIASGIGLALPEALQDRDARSWFKRFEVCAVANEWDDEKKLKRLPTLLKGRAWAIFDSLPDASTDTYTHLKEALLSRLSPDTEEDRQSARDELGKESFVKTKRALMSWPEI